MITLANVFNVTLSIVPLYVVTFVAYASLRWWKIFTPDQCAGINKFVSSFSIPLLSFQVISRNNPYKMGLKLVLADFLQKLIAFAVLAVVSRIRSIGGGGMRWVITGLSLSTLPNTLVLGIPLLRAMYGDQAAELLSQIVVLQSLIWYNLLLILFEVHAAKESVDVLPHSGITGESENSHGSDPRDDNREVERTEKRKRSMRSIFLTVGRKLIKNPNTYASLAGITWAFIHFRWGVSLPKFVDDSISILADGGLGMAMFTLGLFMASQASLIPCGKRKAVLAIALKFVAGPALMAVPSFALGFRGTLLHVAIVQAALPQGVVPFVFAKEYNRENCI